MRGVHSRQEHTFQWNYLQIIWNTRLTLWEEGELNALQQETPLRGLDNLSAKMLMRFSEQMGWPLIFLSTLSHNTCTHIHPRVPFIAAPLCQVLAVYTFFQVILTAMIWGYVYYYPYFTNKDWGLTQLNKVPRIRNLVSGRHRVSPNSEYDGHFLNWGLSFLGVT